MAFGKKKKKKQGRQEKQVSTPAFRYQKHNNPLYPKKVESDVKAIGIALGTVVVAFALVGVIFTNFSYAANPNPMSQNQTDSGSDDYLVAQTPADVSSEEGEDTNTSSGAISPQIGVPAEEDPEERVQNSTEAVEMANYILPESSTRALTASDLAGLTKNQLRILRNEIYARHGRRFNDASLQQYFDSQPWYQGTIAPAQFDEGVLSEVEKANIDLIKKYE